MEDNSSTGSTILLFSRFPWYRRTGYSVDFLCTYRYRQADIDFNSFPFYELYTVNKNDISFQKQELEENLQNLESFSNHKWCEYIYFKGAISI